MIGTIELSAVLWTLAFFVFFGGLVISSIRRDKKLLAQGICPTCANTGLHPLANGITIDCENARCPVLTGSATRVSNPNYYC